MEIYVGNLPWSTSDQDLADAFGPYGSVEKASSSRTVIPVVQKALVLSP